MKFGSILVMPMCWLYLNRASKTVHGSHEDTDRKAGVKESRTVVAQPPYAAELPGGLVKTQSTKPLPQGF